MEKKKRKKKKEMKKMILYLYVLLELEVKILFQQEYFRHVKLEFCSLMRIVMSDNTLQAQNQVLVPTKVLFTHTVDTLAGM